MPTSPPLYVTTTFPHPKNSIIQPTPNVPRTFTTSHAHTRLVRILHPHPQQPRLPSPLTRRHRITRRYIQRRIPGEEIPRPEEQCHRLGGHDGKVFRRGEVGDAKGVPEDDVGVFDGGGGGVGDPGREAGGGGAGCLGDVAAGGVDLVVFVWRGGLGVSVLWRGDSRGGKGCGGLGS